MITPVNGEIIIFSKYATNKKTVSNQSCYQKIDSKQNLNSLIQKHAKKREALF